MRRTQLATLAALGVIAGLPALGGAQSHRGDDLIAAFIAAVEHGQADATKIQDQVTSAGKTTAVLEPKDGPAKFKATADDFKDLDAVVAAVGTAQDLLDSFGKEYPQIPKDQDAIHRTWMRIQGLDWDYYREQYPKLQGALASFHTVYAALGTARTGIEKYAPDLKPTPKPPTPKTPRRGTRHGRVGQTPRPAPPPPPSPAPAKTGLKVSQGKGIDHLAAFLWTATPADVNLASSLNSLVVQDATNADQVLVLNQDALTPLENAVKLRIQFKKEVDALGKLKGIPPTDSIKTADGKLRDVVKPLLARVDGWSSGEEQEAKGRVLTERALLTNLVNDPRTYRIDALTEAKLGQAFVDAVGKTAKTEAALLTDLQDPNMPSGWAEVGPTVAALTRRWSRITGATTGLTVLMTELGVDHDDNITSWTQDEIPLYYFDDVPRLIQFLNKDKATQQVSDATAQASEATARATLDQAGQDLVNKRADVANAKNSLATAQEALRQAQIQLQTEQAGLDRANLNNVKSLADLQKAQDDAQAKVDHDTQLVANDQTEADKAAADLKADTSKPPDPALVAKADSTRKQLEADELTLADDKSALAKAKNAMTTNSGQQTAIESTAAQRVADLKTQVAAYQTKLDAAQQAETTANSALSTSMLNVFVAGAMETRSFAKARDNAPFWYAMPTTPFLSQTDPVKRVMLYGSPDSRTLFVRGREADVDAVKQLVQKLDRPAAQAEMTLYTVQINSTADRPGVRYAQEAERIVQDELAIERAGTQVASDLLTAKVNAVVMNPDFVRPSDKTAKPASDEALWTKDLGTQGSPATRRMIAFYGLLTLEELGLKPTDFAEGLSPDFVQVALPRPVNAATLGEALVAIALTDGDRRKGIIDAFEGTTSPKDPNPSPIVPALQSSLEGIPGLTDESRAAAKKFLTKLPSNPFFNLRRIVGDDGNGPEITSLREDILGQLRLRLPDVLTNRMTQRALNIESELRALESLNSQLGSLIKEKGVWDATSASELWRAQGVAAADILTEVNVLRQEARVRGRLTGTAPSPSEAILLAIQRTATDLSLLTPKGEAGLPPGIGVGDRLVVQLAPEGNQLVVQVAPTSALSAPIAALSAAAAAPTMQMQTRALASAAQTSVTALLESLRSLYREVRYIGYVPPKDWYDRYHAQLARANETLSRLMHGIDEDMKANFVRPMVDRLGKRLLESKISVGVFQKTSILASNRLIAQVDPQASAEFGGENQNSLQDLVNFMTLFGGAVSGSTGLQSGPTGSLAAALLPGAKPVTGALGAVKGFTTSASNLPAGAPAGVYGMSAGNTFTVTPIFDPTGQALRFKLDFFSSTQIRESDNSTSPAFPRIERHSVNTEVRLSNFETADVSEFLVNSRLGKASSKHGGIPFLKDIYPLSEVPVIGWFTRQRIQAAEVQQSLILTQTSMYPTIQDIIELLTSSPAEVGSGK